MRKQACPDVELVELFKKTALRRLELQKVMYEKSDEPSDEAIAELDAFEDALNDAIAFVHERKLVLTTLICGKLRTA